MAVTRRNVLLASLGFLGGCASGARGRRGAATLPDAAHGSEAPHAVTPDQALRKLVDGNQRFAEGRAMHPHETREWRNALVAHQHPFAVVLGCADSRVSPEVVFDEGLGDLFVIRQAGHVADDDSLGSIEYAVGHLHVPLVVVLGHEACGAVAAAVGAIMRDEAVEGHILRLVDDIAPAVQEVQQRRGDVVEHAVRANVRHVVRRLRSSVPVLRPRERRGQIQVVGGYYSLRTGVVEWLAV